MPTVPQLPVAVTVGANDLVPISQSGVLRTATVQQIQGQSGSGGAGLGFTPGVGLSFSFGTLSVAAVPLSAISTVGGAVGQVLTLTSSGLAYVTPAGGGSGGSSYTAQAPITLTGTVFGIMVGTAAGTVAAGNDARIVGAAQTSSLAAVAQSGSYADLLNKPSIPIVGTTSGTVAAGNDTRITGAEQSSNKGQPNGYAGLDGSGRIALSVLNTSTGSTGQVLTLTSGGLAFATPTTGTTYTGVSPISISGSSISLGQAGATVGQVLAWSGTAWTPTTPTAATVNVVKIDGSAIPGSSASPYQMLTNDRFVYVSKITGAPTSILLPTNPTLGVEYKVKDLKGDAGTNNITIAGASGVTIDGQASFVSNANFDAITLCAATATVWAIT